MKAVMSNYRATDEAGGDERGFCRQFTELLIEESKAGGSGERLALYFLLLCGGGPMLDQVFI